MAWLQSSIEVVEFPLVRERRPLADALRNAADPGLARSACRGEPAVLIDSPAGHDVKELGVLSSFCLCVVEGVDHAHAVERVLAETVDDLRCGNFEDLVDGRNDVVDVMELGTRCFVGLDSFGPGDGHRIAGSAEVGSLELGALIGRAAGPGPTGVVHVVGFGRRERRVRRVPQALRDAGRSLSGMPFWASCSLIVP